MEPTKEELEQIGRMMEQVEVEMRGGKAGSVLAASSKFTVPAAEVEEEDDEELLQPIVVNVYAQMPEYPAYPAPASGSSAASIVSFLLLVGVTALIWMSVLAGK